MVVAVVVACLLAWMYLMDAIEGVAVVLVVLVSVVAVTKLSATPKSLLCKM